MKLALHLSEDLDRLRERVASERQALQRDRYRAVLLVALESLEGHEVARLLGRSPRFVDEWAGRYRRGGLADRCPAGGIGVIDATGHPKRGDKTPGVQRQYCGESGKIDNCVVAQHLLFTDDDAANPFSCVLASDLYLPRGWAEDRARCREAGVPDELEYRPKWRISLEQVRGALAGGVKLNWAVFDAIGGW